MFRPVIFIFIMVLLSTGCKKENMCDCVKSTGTMVTEKRALSSFNKIEVRKNTIVTLYQDTVEYVEIEAGSNLIDLVKTEVQDGLLLITNLNTCNWVRSYDAEIHVRVHLKKINHIAHFGSEELRSVNTLVTDELDIRENNSADIRLMLDVQRVYARQMIGGGDIYLSGNSGFCYTFGGSFGYIYAGDFISDSVQVDHRSTGEIHVNAVSWLGAYIADRGNVYYKGEPAITSEITGSGRLIRE